MPSVTVPQQVLAAYELPGTPVSIGRYGQGHINDTFCITCQMAAGEYIRFILQGLSTSAFPQPEKVMENFVRITDFLRGKILAAGGDPTRRGRACGVPDLGVGRAKVFLLFLLTNILDKYIM